MPYISLDDCVDVEVEVEVSDVRVSTGEAYFEVHAEEIECLDDYIKDEVRTYLNENHQVVDAKAVAVEILRMLADILQQG